MLGHPCQLTIGEACPNARRFKSPKWTAMLLVVSCVFAMGFYILRTLVADDPLYLARVLWRLPVLILFHTYVSLIMVIHIYMFMYLPHAPLAVDEALMIFGLCATGGVALVMMTTGLGLPVEDSRVVMACAGVLAVLVAGLLAFWAWLIRKYGDKPVDSAPKLTEDQN